jgi:hypothetical protein
MLPEHIDPAQAPENLPAGDAATALLGAVLGLQTCPRRASRGLADDATSRCWPVLAVMGSVRAARVVTPSAGWRRTGWALRPVTPCLRLRSSTWSALVVVGVGPGMV